jgi:hypothetical protein
MSDKQPIFDSTGKQVAEFLAGSWRKSPGKLAMTAINVTAIAPLLLRSGAGALAWWRLRNSGMSAIPVGTQFREAYMTYAVHSLEQEHRIADVIAALRADEVEAILFKGSAISRLYPESGLRPTGDIDLCVHPDQRTKAIATLAKRRRQHWVDFDHVEISQYSERSFEEIYHRSETVELQGCMVQVLGAEDHLRAICLHFLKHGGWRPLWLCDIAAVVEPLPDRVNWAAVYGKNARWADWIACTLLLAQELLGARLGSALSGMRKRCLPAWLVAAVLKQWSSPHAEPLPSFTDHIGINAGKAGILSAIAQRWPNPIQATVDVNGPFDRRPRMPFQLANWAVRSAKLIGQWQRDRWQSR